MSTEIHEKVLGKGIDARNAENQLDPGYWEDLRNAETDGNIVKKRRGYQQLGSYMPFRVSEIEYNATDTQICFTLADYVDLSRVRSDPIVVRGTYYGGGIPDFPDGILSQQYYNSFEIAIRRTPEATPNPLIFSETIPQAAHGHSSWLMHAVTLESTSNSSLSNELIIEDELEISFVDQNDPTTLTQSEVFLSQPIEFIFPSVDAGTIGSDHYYPNSGGVPSFISVPKGSPYTFDELNINTATDLKSVNLIVSVYERNPLTPELIRKVIPDNVEIDGSSGEFKLYVTIADPGAPDDPGDPDLQYIYVVSAVDEANTLSGQVTASTQEVVLSTENPFHILGIYTQTGSIREMVFPDSVVYDDTAKELTITFQTNDAVNYQIYYLEAGLTVNQLCVSPNATGYGGSVNPSTYVELDVYGLDPLQVMSIKDRNHWVTHIDTYRSVDLRKLVAGVGGVQYELASPSNLISLLPRYEQVLESETYLVPLFQPTGATFSGSGRGYITFDNLSGGAEMETIEYQSGTGYVRFTLSAINLDVSNSNFTDNLDGTFTSTLDRDLLTVKNAGFTIMNGSHAIQSMTLDTNTNQIIVDCLVEGVTNSDWDEVDVGGYCQVYTSPLVIGSLLVDTNTFFKGTSITLGGNTYTVRGNDFTSVEKLYIDGVLFNSVISQGSFILGTHTSDFIPTRSADPGNPASTGEYTKGDMVKYSSFDRWINIKNVIQYDTTDVTVSGNTVTFPAPGDALNFEAGQRIALLANNLEGGVFTVQSVADDTNLTIDGNLTIGTARFIGKAIQIDEELTVSDTVDNSLSFSPTARWHAIQKPDVPTAVGPQFQAVNYPFSTFEVGSQPNIKSTMVADNLYLTNGDDAILKFDGINLSRAGLFRWEGGTFVRKVSSGAGGMPLNTGSITGTISLDSKIFSSDDVLQFTAGQQATLSGGGSPQKVVVKDVDVANGKISLDTPANAAHTTLTEAAILKYYFRLNLIDANNNIIGSAVSGSNNDYVIEMTDETVVGIRLAKPPKLDMFDYDRLEYEIYRTVQSGSVFYKVATIKVPQTPRAGGPSTEGYVYFEDTVSDDQLSEPDPISASTLGAELATAVDEPLRAKFITSANNRLVLGNLKDNPSVDVRIFRPTTELSDADLDGLTFTFTDSTSTINYQFKSNTDSLNGVTVTGSGIFSGLTSSFTQGHWYYIGTTGTESSPIKYGWFKARAGNALHLYPSSLTSYGSDDFIIAGTADTIPLPALNETTDGDAGYQSGGNQLKISNTLVNAINATQFELENFALVGEGRTDSAELGRFTVRSVDNTNFSLTITHSASPNLFGNATVFINNIQASSGTAIASEEQSYASRMLVSFPSFPEIFDRPRAIIPEDSLSVIDVNSADGQEITGIIPFFGESTSQDSSKQDIVICFKENSIYAVNIRTRVITKIDSRGVGCDAPGSIAAVPNGIIFAHRSGVYRLNRGFDVIWVGRYLSRVWNENTNLNQLALAQGHVYPQEKQYRLSVPVGTDARATEVYVYEYGDEAAGQVGAWTRFNNIPSTGWASDGTESYFGSSIGKVFTIRNTRTNSDYRDDDQPVQWSGTYRAVDFNAPGTRKLLRAVITHFRVLIADRGTTLEVATDLTDGFSPTTSFVLQDSIETTLSNKITSIRQNVDNQKGVYYQLRYQNATIDTPVELAGITFRVAGLDYTGIKQASETGE